MLDVIRLDPKLRNARVESGLPIWAIFRTYTEGPLKDVSVIEESTMPIRKGTLVTPSNGGFRYRVDACFKVVENGTSL